MRKDKIKKEERNRIWGVIIIYKNGSIQRELLGSVVLGNLIARWRGVNSNFVPYFENVFPLKHSGNTIHIEKIINYDKEIILINYDEIQCIKYELNKNVLGDIKYKEIYDWDKDL